MNIKKVVVGNLNTNCYLLFKNNQCLIIDPGAEEDKIIKEIGANVVQGILITHRHFDHIGAEESLKKKYDCPVFDKSNLQEQNYKINQFDFDVIYTPGHTSDSVSYYFNNEHLFTGDFLFEGTIGRYDFSTGDYNTLMNSLDKIKKYPPQIKIYPGHANTTTLQEELRTNPYLNIK